MPSFPRATFNKVAKARCDVPLKRDESDVLLYLIYMDYLNKLVRSSQQAAGAAEISVRDVDAVHKKLMKKYRG